MTVSHDLTVPALAPAAAPRPSGDTRVRSLPPDLMGQACKRVAIAAIAFAVLWAFELIMGLKFAGAARDMGIMASGVWPTPGLGVVAVGFTLSIGMVFVAGALSDRPQLLLDLGLVFEVLTAALIGLINQWVPFDAPGRVSWICVLILIYPAIAPNTPKRVLLASLLAASMDPLWFGVALLRGVEPQVSGLGQAWTFTSNYLCALLAVVPAKIFLRLGSQVRQARELGSYRLGERIGSGGMGEVYRAEHRLLARPAAIKLIRPELLGNGNRHDGEVAVARFRREAEAAALLRSPHTIELYDFGITDGGAFYYVMEYLDGVSLEDLVERHGPMPAERAVHLMIQACDSLAEAHARGLIHRDVKPSNLFASRVGLEVDHIKVLDFGLVKADPRTAPDPMLTAPNVATGTPAFMAPEVALGEAVIDPRVDVYALGCVLYWLLTARWVFEAESPLKLMHLHIQEPPEPPSARTELPVPVALDALVLACLAKHPDDRPRDAGELRDRLAGLRLAEGWTRERAQRWWETHRPEQPEPCDPCDQGEVRPVLTSV
jgi:serine/threonine-protein kinase